MPIGGIACGQLYLGGDGRLWLWHIFKTVYSREKYHDLRLDAMTLGGHYAYPDRVFARETRPVEQGVAIRVAARNEIHVRTLDANGFENVTFRGEYPIGRVSYEDDSLPISVQVEALSPFIPTNLADSSLPATVMSYKVKNTSNEEVDISLAGWLENAVLPESTNLSIGVRRNTAIQSRERLTLFGCAEAIEATPKTPQDDLVFEDFESGSFSRWTAAGGAFGSEPVQSGSEGDSTSGVEGNYFVSSFNVRALNGASNESANPYGRITPADKYTGSLISHRFKISHNYITFLISGGFHPKETALNLIVDGNEVRTETGDHQGQFKARFFDVRDLLGEEAQLQVVDFHQGVWGNIAVDHIVFTDRPPTDLTLEEREGYGSLAWSLRDPSKNAVAVVDIGEDATAKTIFECIDSVKCPAPNSATKPLNRKLIGALGEKFTLGPGEEREVSFVLSWFFPHLNEQDSQTGQLLELKDIQHLKRHYANWFTSANQVADYVVGKFDDLVEPTRLWNRTYYDSSLPFWLLDRSFISLNCLATNTLLWFNNGRIWGWEGVECCPGTCQHVWQYAQGLARIFPEAERTLRETMDFGHSFRADGGFGHRDETAGDYGRTVAHDGHCGTIMRAYREHKLSDNYDFLKQHYQQIKKAVRFILNEDKDGDGLLEGEQANTLDAEWYGPMGWISSLYLGAIAAGKAMAIEMGDREFASVCERRLESGRKNIVGELFNGEYFIHKADRSNYPQAINSNDGCHIDQVLGQSFASQYGVPDRVVPRREARDALRSIWKYNFAPDAFAYKEAHKSIKGARVFATAGEAGTIMTTWPISDGDEVAVPGMASRPSGSSRWQGPGGYFDECMNGFEYQVASHMIWEGLLEEGLATARAVHDRYDATKRNPYNEIECSDHYSRSMSSYGVLLAVCGFDYHGPKGHITFDPQLVPNRFKAPFTTAQSWGTFEQNRSGVLQENTLSIKYGKLQLQQMTVFCPGPRKTTIRMVVRGRSQPIEVTGTGERYVIKWKRMTLKAGANILIEMR